MRIALAALAASLALLAFLTSLVWIATSVPTPTDRDGFTHMENPK